jgi:glutamate-5-semialdehyde dehydrogenase
MDASSTFDPAARLHQIRRAATTLGKTDSQTRNQVIQRLAEELREHQNELLEANTLDLEMSRELAVPGVVLNWLKLTPERLSRVGSILDQLVHLPDPLMSHPMMLPTAQGYMQATPLGIVGLVYEAFPELPLLLAAMCWKTGNGLLLQGDMAGRNSNQFVVELLQKILGEIGLPEACVQVSGTDYNQGMQTLAAVDLVIPYGRPRFIQQMHQQARVPTLCPTMGNCYLYWSESCHSEQARTLILDSHVGCPEAVNAIEKVLIPPALKTSRLTLLWGALKEQGFEIRGDAEMVAEFPDLILATKEEWHQPYLQKTVAFRRVADLDHAVQWINAHSHGQADCLATESYAESRRFALNIQSATTYINASPRFSRQWGGPQGTVALGTCSRRSLYPGVISLQTLLATKQIIQGNDGAGAGP